MAPLTIAFKSLSFEKDPLVAGKFPVSLA